MATPSQRRLEPTSVRHFGTGLGKTFELPDLTALQTISYAAFLQEGAEPKKRKNQGLVSRESADLGYRLLVADL